MTIKRTLTFVCDRCGKEYIADEGYLRDRPDGWGLLYLGDDEVHVCRECAQKHLILSVALDVGKVHWWMVDDEQIKALAAGVPAEDIFA